MKTTPGDLAALLPVGSTVVNVYFAEPGHGVIAIGATHDTLIEALDAALQRRAADPNYDRPDASGRRLGDTTPVRIDHRVVIRHEGGASDSSALRYEYDNEAEATTMLARMRGWARA